MKFHIQSPRVLFGRGVALEALESFVVGNGRPFLVTGGSPARSAWMEERLGDPGRDGRVFRVTGEPTVDEAMRAARAAREAGSDRVVGLGGGSVLDTAKVVAAMVNNQGELMEYLEVIGGGRSLPEPPAPLLAVPTTAGTGAEVTMNAVLASPEHQVKVSMRGPYMLPAVAAVDPSLTMGLPPAVTAATGMDALVQLIEAFISPMATPFTDALCRQALPPAFKALPVACGPEESPEARAHMALAACFSGLALAHAKLGAVHGLAGTIGGMIHAPHGLICARLLPYVLTVNRRALAGRDPENAALARVSELAGMAGAGEGAPEAFEAWARDLVEKLPLQSLRDFGLHQQDFQAIAEQAQRSSSMKGNPIVLTEEELTEVLEKAVVD